MNRFLILALSFAVPAGAGEAKAAPRTGDFKDAYQNTLKYRLRAPQKLPDRNVLGLVICFHGLNGNEDSITGFALDALTRSGLADQYVIAGGKSKGNGWAEVDDKDLLAWIEWVKRSYPIDPRRVHLIGMSNGGWMVNRFGWKHQGWIATVTAYCGVSVAFSGVPDGKKPGPKGGPGSPADTKTEWYLVHGDADDVVGVDASRLAARQLRNKGYRCLYRELKGGNHVNILGNREVQDDVVRFLHGARHKELPLSKEESAALQPLPGKAKSEKEAAGIAAILAEAQRIGGAPGGKVIVAALSNPDPEVKKAALATTLTTSYGREVVLAMVKLLKEKSEEVKAAAYRGLGAASALRSPEAQEALIRAARTRKTPLAERVLAIEELGKAVKLQFLGAFEDKQAIWTLVLLLDDEDQAVRKATFAELEKLVQDAFQYKPDLPVKERKASLAKWAAWTTGKCGPPEPAARGS
jgi:predicted esterase